MNSHRNKEVGKTPDPTPNLPIDMDPLNTTFGKTVKRDDTAASLVNPPKTYADVLSDSQIAHKLYRKSHNDYYPSEQIDRDYEKPFDRTFCYGKQSKANKSGLKVRRAMRWFNQDTTNIAGSLQKDFPDHAQSRIGLKCHTEMPSLSAHDSLEKKINNRRSDAISEALRDSSFIESKVPHRSFLPQIHSLRLKLKNRFPEVPFDDLQDCMIDIDENNSNVITIEDMYSALADYDIQPEKTSFETLLNLLELVKDGKVAYRNVISLLNWRCTFPSLPRFYEIRTAGLPTRRWDVPYATVPPGKSRCDIENLGDQTTVAALISPSVFTRIGLSHVDFFKIRSKEEIRRIFVNIGMKIPSNDFDIIWEKGLKRDCTGGVCVKTFKYLLDQFSGIQSENALSV